MTIYDGEDWSRVRSPGRARRRRSKHRQNIEASYIPDPQFIVDKTTNSIYCHPAMAKELRAKISKTYGVDSVSSFWQEDKGKFNV